MNPSTTDRRGVQLRIEGSVQGVGFRWWTREIAAELGLTGSVRNLDDGAVEITAFGTTMVLADLTRAVQTGPVSARVERVTETPIDLPDPVPTDFTIRG